MPSLITKVNVMVLPQGRFGSTVKVKFLVMAPPGAIAPKFCDAEVGFITPPVAWSVAVKFVVLAAPVFCSGKLTVICSPGSGRLFGVPQLSAVIVGPPADATTATPVKQKLTVDVCPSVTVTV